MALAPTTNFNFPRPDQNGYERAEIAKVANAIEQIDTALADLSAETALALDNLAENVQTIDGGTFGE